MLDLFKKDVKIGDNVRLHLTTGKDPQGIVEEIGDNFVLLRGDNDVLIRFFDKLIGGWDILIKQNEIVLKEPSTLNQQKENIDDALLLYSSENILHSLDKKLLNTIISSNANIVKIHGSIIIASNLQYPEIILHKSKIIDEKLENDLQ